MDTNTLAVSPNTAVPPATAVNPEAKQIPAPSPPGGSHSPRSKPFNFTLMMTLALFFAIV